MKKFEVVKRHEEFNDIINNAKYKKNENFTIYIRKGNYPYPRFGIIDFNKAAFKNYTDYIIMIKRSCLSLTYQQMNDKLIELIKDDDN